MIHPGAARVHCFPIKNDSDRDWSVKAIRAECRCTASAISSSRIPKGTTSEVSIKYSPPESRADEARSVQVEFEEADAPLIRLTIRAKVRAPITPSTSEVVFSAVAESAETPDQVVSVENFTDRAWDHVRVASDAAWLRASVLADLGANPAPHPPLEARRILLTADPRGLGVGSHFAALRIEAQPKDGEPAVRHTATLPVYLRVEAAIRAMPEKFFFGEVPVGRSCTRKLRVVCAPGRAASGPLSVTTTAASEVSVEQSRIDERTWELVATLKARASDRSREST